MNSILENIFKSGEFKTSDNKIVKVSSETSKQQCLFLQNIIKENQFTRSLEIGFAFGTSTLAITEQIVKNGGKHLVIDKFEISDWGGAGLDLINQAGYSQGLEFIEDYCYIALPKLLEYGRKFDFAYIDSTKLFDWLLVNFFYIDKVLEKKGIIVFDDVCFASIRKLLRYISQFPSYKVYSQFSHNSPLSKSRKLAQLLNLLPRSKIFLKEELIKSDFELGINANCIALMKLDDDKRDGSWHIGF